MGLGGGCSCSSSCRVQLQPCGGGDSSASSQTQLGFKAWTIWTAAFQRRAAVDCNWDGLRCPQICQLFIGNSSTVTVMQFASCKHFGVQSSAIAKSLAMTCALNENMYNSCRCSRCAVHIVHQCIAFIFKYGFVAPLWPPTDCGVGYSPAGEQLAGLPEWQGPQREMARPGWHGWLDWLRATRVPCRIMSCELWLV